MKLSVLMTFQRLAGMAKPQESGKTSQTRPTNRGGKSARQR